LAEAAAAKAIVELEGAGAGADADAVEEGGAEEEVEGEDKDEEGEDEGEEEEEGDSEENGEEDEDPDAVGPSDWMDKDGKRRLTIAQALAFDWAVWDGVEEVVVCKVCTELRKSECTIQAKMDSLKKHAKSKKHSKSVNKQHLLLIAAPKPQGFRARLCRHALHGPMARVYL